MLVILYEVTWKYLTVKLTHITGRMKQLSDTDEMPGTITMRHNR